MRKAPEPTRRNIPGPAGGGRPAWFAGIPPGNKCRMHASEQDLQTPHEQPDPSHPPVAVGWLAGFEKGWTAGVLLGTLVIVTAVVRRGRHARNAITPS